MKSPLHLILASHNKHKVSEINLLLKNTSIRFKSLSEIGYFGEIIEDGKTLEENAQIKASTIYNKYDLPSVGEDTGLEVYALNNRPGVFTARYGGIEKDANKNMNRLLSELESVHDRRARFRTCIFLKTENEEKLFEGIVEGKIGHTRKGLGGFGYDPIFIPQGYNETFAELPLSIKSKISHRARAMAKLIAYLQKSIESNL